MEPITYRFSFPFTAKVKTQLKIVTSRDGSKRLIKPSNVKRFEEAVRTILSVVFPFESRPIVGYLKFEMYHYTCYKREPDGLIVPVQKADIDNIAKCVIDCFQPVYGKFTKLDEDGNIVFTTKGQVSYTKKVIAPGIIKDDKYITKADLNWVPVETKDEERLEVYITPLTEESLFNPRLPRVIEELDWYME